MNLQLSVSGLFAITGSEIPMFFFFFRQMLTKLIPKPGRVLIRTNSRLLETVSVVGAANTESGDGFCHYLALKLVMFWLHS
jgi:hypothetical protein